MHISKSWQTNQAENKALLLRNRTCCCCSFITSGEKKIQRDGQKFSVQSREPKNANHRPQVQFCFNTRIIVVVNFVAL